MARRAVHRSSRFRWASGESEVGRGLEPPPLVLPDVPGIGGERGLCALRLRAEGVQLAAEAVDGDAFLEHVVVRLGEAHEPIRDHKGEDEGRQAEEARVGGVRELVLECAVSRPAPEPDPVGQIGDRAAEQGERERGDGQNRKVGQRVAEEVDRIEHGGHVVRGAWRCQGAAGQGLRPSGARGC